MDSVETIVAGHYGSGRVMEGIRAALARACLGARDVTEADLKAVDEFHTGGAAATGESRGPAAGGRGRMSAAGGQPPVRLRQTWPMMSPPTSPDLGVR